MGRCSEYRRFIDILRFHRYYVLLLSLRCDFLHIGGVDTCTVAIGVQFLLLLLLSSTITNFFSSRNNIDAS